MNLSAEGATGRARLGPPCESQAAAGSNQERLLDQTDRDSPRRWLRQLRNGPRPTCGRARIEHQHGWCGERLRIHRRGRARRGYRAGRSRVRARDAAAAGRRGRGSLVRRDRSAVAARAAALGPSDQIAVAHEAQRARRERRARQQRQRRHHQPALAQPRERHAPLTTVTAAWLRRKADTPRTSCCPAVAAQSFTVEPQRPPTPYN